MKNLNSLIEVKNLDVNVTKKIRLINNVSLEINEGDYIAIVGENGVGKSTLIEYITKQRFSKKVKHKKGLVVSYVPQFSMNDEYVRVFLYRYALMLNSAQNIPYVIKAFSLEDLVDLTFNEVSAGERQRIILAISFLRKPDIIILDEFSIGLDEFARKQFIKMINNLKKENNFALLVISHVDWVIKELADKVYVVENKELRRLDD